MIRLRQTAGADTGRDLEFDADLVRIGRMPDSDINFDPEVDLDASGRHAELRRERGRYLLIDTGSRNGTWLNGERVKHAALNSGDEIEFGRGGPKLVVSAIANPPTSRAPTGRLTSGKIRREPIPNPAKVPVTATTRLEDLVEVANHTLDKTERVPQPAFSYRPDLQTEIATDAPPGNDVPDPARRRRLIIIAAAVAGVVVAAGVGAWLTIRGAATEAAHATRISDAAIQTGNSLGRIFSVDANGARKLVCFGFALKPKLFATTASCVAAIQNSQRAGAQFVLTSANDEERNVERMWHHPEFKADQTSPNVAFLEVDQPVKITAELAPPARIERLAREEEVFLFSELGGPVGVRVTGLQSLAHGDPTGYSTVLYSAPGTEGSPVVDAEGLVVAVHVGDTTSLGGYGVRADLVHGLLRGLEQQPVF